MTPRSEARTTTTQPGTQVRLQLKPTAPATGYVDGAWWPRSRDLATEIAALADGLADRIGRIERVAYALSSWDAPPRKADLGGSRVRLEGFTYQDKNIIHVTGANRGRVSLLVVPPETADKAGEHAMSTAGHRDNADLPAEILAGASLPAPRDAAGHSAARWENDGGRRD